MLNKSCTTCNVSKPLSSFHKKKEAALGVKSSCKDCVAKWQLTHYNKPGIKEKRIKRQSSEAYQLYIRKFRLNSQYGLSLDDYNAMLNEQEHSCSICKAPESDKKYLAVDHCHKSGKIRSLLCQRCNLVLGQVSDRSDLLANMINYLSRHS